MLCHGSILEGLTNAMSTTLQEIRGGSFVVVYLYYQPSLDSIVAVKLLRLISMPRT
jgi:hypothetical protein